MYLKQWNALKFISVESQHGDSSFMSKKGHMEFYLIINKMWNMTKGMTAEREAIISKKYD